MMKKKQVIKKRGGGIAKKRGGGMMKKSNGGAINQHKKMAMGMNISQGKK